LFLRSAKEVTVVAIATVAWVVWGFVSRTPFPWKRQVAPFILGALLVWVNAAVFFSDDIYWKATPPWLPTDIGAASLTLAMVCGCGFKRYQVIAYVAFAVALITFFQWDGNTHKNAVGGAAVIATGLLLTLRSSPALLLAIISSSIAFNTPSGAGKIGIMVLWGIYIGCWFIQKQRVLGAIAVFLGGVAGVFMWPKILNAIGKEETLTGRTGIWETAVAWTIQNPLFGNGTNFWINQGRSIRINDNHFPCGSAHNGFLEGSVMFGMPALFLLVLLICSAVIQMQVSYRYKLLLLAAGVLPMLTEAVGFATVGGAATLCGWLAFCLARSQKEGT